MLGKQESIIKERHPKLRRFQGVHCMYFIVFLNFTEMLCFKFQMKLLNVYIKKAQSQNGGNASSPGSPGNPPSSASSQ